MPEQLKPEDMAFAGYASRSGVTVEWLKEQGFHAEPCDCGDETCQGWQMVSKDAAPDPRAAALGANLSGPVDNNLRHLRIAQQILYRGQQVPQRRLAVPHWRT